MPRGPYNYNHYSVTNLTITNWRRELAKGSLAFDPVPPSGRSPRRSAMPRIRSLVGGHSTHGLGAFAVVVQSSAAVAQTRDVQDTLGIAGSAQVQRRPEPFDWLLLALDPGGHGR